MAVERAEPPLKKRRGRPPVVREFYGDVLDAAERIKLRDAATIEGVDEEIAVLRTKLREAVKGERPEDFKLMLRGLDILVRLVSARYRLSKKSREDLAAHLSGLIDGVSAELYGEGQDGS